jgi:subtilase family serine protease
MKMKDAISSLLSVAALIGLGTITALAQFQPVPNNVTLPPSSVAKPSDTGMAAHTNIRILGSQGMSGTPQTSGPPFPGYFYETPASLACIYRLQPPSADCNSNVVTANPAGGKKAIAIVDAYDYPVAASDLTEFVTQFGVEPITPSSFQVVYAPFGGVTPGSCVGTGTQPSSAAGTGWDLEEALDIEYAHSMAPQAMLYLVEAQTNSFADLSCAVSVASNLVAAAGGGEVSMSWGGGEWPGETSYDPVFTKRNVVYYAATGDSPGTIYPSVSPNVVAAGGTTLSTNANTGAFENENSWQDGGGGQASFESRPGYQNGIAHIVGTQRGVPDVAAVANPNTGVWVYNSTYFPPYVWWIVGGTSVATPTWAGIANSMGRFAPSSFAELTSMYWDPEEFHHITYGTCGVYIGYFAGPGWNFCTGLGSPQGPYH